MVAIALEEFSLYTSVSTVPTLNLKPILDYSQLQRDKAKTAVLIWEISTAATDIGIAGALIWQLISMKSYSSVADTRS
jgi:hypothetical protein